MPSLFEVVNMDEVLSHMDAKNLLGEPLRNYFERVGVDIERQARQRTSVGVSGLMRSSWTHEVDGSDIPISVVVGNPREYAPYMEFGTGRMGDAEAPYAHKDSHWPPGDALALWATRRGLNPYAIARAIGIRGGLTPRRWLRDAMASAQARMSDFFDKLTSEIGTNWSNE